MNSLFFLIATTVLSAIHNGTGNTDTNLLKQIIPVESSFSNIIIYNDIKVYITEGVQNEIVFKNEEVANKVKFRVNDEALIIRCKNGLFSSCKPVSILIMVKKIDGITIMGDADVKSIGDLSCKKLMLIVNGDGSICISTKAFEVESVIKGLGKIEVRGNFKNTSVNKDPSGNMMTTYNQ